MTRLFSYAVFLVFFCLSTGLASAADTVSRVVFVPLESDSAGKYAPVVGGIGNMLASQLATKDRIEPVDYVLKAKELEALKGGSSPASSAALNVDYIIRGAVYALDKGLSLQIQVLPVRAGAVVQNFSAVAAKETDIFTAVDKVAADIAGQVFAYENKSVSKDVAAAGIAGFDTVHPEREYKRGVLGAGSLYSGELSEIADVKGVRRSPVVPMDIVSMAVGDLNGDGKDEMIYASRSKLLFYQELEQRFVQIGEYDFSPSIKIHAVNVADRNGDGKDEIYVSSNFKHGARSEVLSWNQKSGAQSLLTIDGWYMRPVIKPGEKTVFVGQRGSKDRTKGYVLPGLYELAINSDLSGFSQGELLPLPKGIGVFDFAWADVTGDKQIELVAIDRRERLLIYDKDNQLLHVSAKNYGGSTNYIGVTLAKGTGEVMQGYDDALKSNADWNFIPTRLIIEDFNGDGTNEIVVGANQRDNLVTSGRKKEKGLKDKATSLVDNAINFFKNSRSYEGGTVACLSYKDGALTEIWRTNTITGYLADYSYMTGLKQNAEGKEQKTVQLYVAQVPSNSFLGYKYAKESKVLLYEFDYK